MSRGHNAHKGFSQTSKRFDGELKAQHQHGRSTQHSSQTAKESMEKSEKGSQKSTPSQMNQPKH